MGGCNIDLDTILIFVRRVHHSRNVYLLPPGVEATTRTVGDPRTQFDEVWNLRRDLGVTIRQVYSEFMELTRNTPGSLCNQTKNVPQLASTRVPRAQSYSRTARRSWTPGVRTC